MLCSRHPWMQISQLKHSGKQKRRCKHLSKPRTEENLRLHLVGFDETYSQRWRDFRLLRNFLEAIIHWELVYTHCIHPVHTVVLKWIINKDLLSSTGSSAQYSVITLWFPRGRMGERIVREFGMDMNTLLCLTWITNKDLLSSTGNSAQCHVAAWMEGSLGEKGYINLYGWIPHLHTTIQNELNKKITENQSINHWDLLS